MQLNRNIFTRFTAVICAAAMLSACSGDKAAPAGAMDGGKGGHGGMQTKASAISVNIESPVRETLERQTDFAAKIEANQTVKVYPQVSGTVSKTYFNAGDRVNKGDLLFELDSDDAETSLRQAQLSYDKTMANLTSEESGSGNANTIRKYENAIQTAQNNYETARDNLEYATENDFDMSEFKRVRKKLWDTEKAYDADQSTENWAAYVNALDKYNDLIDDYASYTNYKNQITSFENAYTNYLKAVEDYDIYKSMTIGEEAVNRDISREQAELTLSTAQKNYDDHKIYAPVSGIVAAKTVSEYDNAGSNTAAYTISQEGMPCVSFNLSEDGANAMDIGTPVTVWYNGKSYYAEVTELSPEADSTGLYPTKAQLLEDIGTTRSGSVVKVTAITAQEENTLTVSLDNVYYDGNQAYVFVYENGIARRRDITVGMTTVDKVSVVEGLTDSDEIISTWHPRLKDGAEVTTASATEIAAAQSQMPEKPETNGKEG